MAEDNKRIKEEGKEEEGAKTAIISQRCAIPAEIYNEIAPIAATSKKTNCEIQVEGLRYYVNRMKLRSDCQTGQVAGEVCKYVDV